MMVMMMMMSISKAIDFINFNTQCADLKKKKE